MAMKVGKEEEGVMDASFFQVGCHLSASKGFLAMGKEALSIGANTFQFFTRNPRGGSAKPFDGEDARAFVALATAKGIQTVLAHAPYTLNPCAADPKIREFTWRTMADDLERMDRLAATMAGGDRGERLGAVLYNFHPGSHVGQGAEAGIRLIADALNGILRPDQRTVVLLETMAGKGSEVGRSFEEIRAIVDGVRDDVRDRLGVCLDTCHVHDGGYAVVGDLDGVLSTFDKVVGLGRLKAIHCNDSKNPMGSHKDRHELIGQGTIGVEAFRRILRHPALAGLPFYLETPNDVPGYGREIALLRNLRNG